MEDRLFSDTDTTSLRTVVYGGAPMAVEHIKAAMREWGPVFGQGYGQWEAPFTTYLSPAEHEDALAANESRLMSAGRAMRFTRVGIMAGDEPELLPPEQEGEVVLAGDHVMVGYLGLRTETAQIRAQGWQRTGDVGRLDKDGYLYLTDRKRDVIVTGGSNVYPRAIEEVLHRHPEVDRAVVVGVPDDMWGETVHAVVVPRAGTSLDADAFLAWCRKELPVDGRPRSVATVDDIPTNPYGTPMRRELREQYWRGKGRMI